MKHVFEPPELSAILGSKPCFREMRCPHDGFPPSHPEPVSMGWAGWFTAPISQEASHPISMCLRRIYGKMVKATASDVDAISGALKGLVPPDLDRHAIREQRLADRMEKYAALDD